MDGDHRPVPFAGAGDIADHLVYLEVAGEGVRTEKKATSLGDDSQAVEHVPTNDAHEWLVDWTEALHDALILGLTDELC